VTARLQALLDEGVASGVFPCARAVVLRGGARVFEGGAGRATARACFDLASLTKVIATTSVFLSLWADDAIVPATPVRQVLPDSAAGRAGITVRDLLYHRAGLPAFVPFFADVLREDPGLLDAAPAPVRRDAARRAVVARALATPPAAPCRAAAVYSDVGFVVLGEVLAAVAGIPLDRAFAERVATPLELPAGYRRISTAGPPDPETPPTGTTRPRAPAPGQEGLWPALPSRPSPPGEVDDDNAWAMDGVAGHAGLFGTAEAVARFGRAVLDEIAGTGRLAPPSLWEEALRRDAETPGSTRALGFDTRLPGDPAGDSSAGRHLGGVAPGAAGHVGFTGVSLWIDRGRDLVVSLCTNRTALGRADTRIRGFRQRFHDAAVDA
jgi:CubicO group peptidase (beta-lactamase class C family)